MCVCERDRERERDKGEARAYHFVPICSQIMTDFPRRHQLSFLMKKINEVFSILCLRRRQFVVSTTLVTILTKKACPEQLVKLYLTDCFTALKACWLFDMILFFKRFVSSN